MADGAMKKSGPRILWHQHWSVCHRTDGMDMGYIFGYGYVEEEQTKWIQKVCPSSVQKIPFYIGMLNAIVAANIGGKFCDFKNEKGSR